MFLAWSPRSVIGRKYQVVATLHTIVLDHGVLGQDDIAPRDHVGSNDKPGEVLISYRVHSVLHHAQDFEPRQDGFCLVIGKGHAGVVSSSNGIGSCHDSAPCME